MRRAASPFCRSKGEQSSGSDRHPKLVMGLEGHTPPRFGAMSHATPDWIFPRHYDQKLATTSAFRGEDHHWAKVLSLMVVEFHDFAHARRRIQPLAVLAGTISAAPLSVQRAIQSSSLLRRTKTVWQFAARLQPQSVVFNETRWWREQTWNSSTPKKKGIHHTTSRKEDFVTTFGLQCHPGA